MWHRVHRNQPITQALAARMLSTVRGGVTSRPVLAFCRLRECLLQACSQQRHDAALASCLLPSGCVHAFMQLLGRRPMCALINESPDLLYCPTWLSPGYPDPCCAGLENKILRRAVQLHRSTPTPLVRTCKSEACLPHTQLHRSRGQAAGRRIGSRRGSNMHVAPS